jgi:hypothetical protein
VVVVLAADVLAFLAVEVSPELAVVPLVAVVVSLATVVDFFASVVPPAADVVSLALVEVSVPSILVSAWLQTRSSIARMASILCDAIPNKFN